MLILLTIWLLLYFLLSVLGEGVISIARRGQLRLVSQTETILLGLVSLVGVLQVVSIFSPVTYWSVAGLVLVALGINWRLANQPIQRAMANLYNMRNQPLIWLLLLVMLLYATGPPTNPDSSTYHLASIRYVERFPAIPGLGNLFSRLAFNSSFFVAGAAFGFTTLAGQTLFPLNGFLLLLLGSYIVMQLQKPAIKPVLWSIQLSTLLLALFFLIRQINAPTADVWATILPLFVFLFWLADSPCDDSFRPFLLTALVLTGVTVKLSTLPMLLFLPLLAYRYRHRFTGQYSVWALVLCCFLLGPWLVRNVILSGYLLFPLAELDLFSVDWKVAQSVAQYEQAIVTHWARFHVSETEFDPQRLTWSFGRWVSWWWTHWWFWYDWPNRPTFILAALSPILMIIQWVYSPNQVRSVLGAYAVALAGFLFWFLKAPEFRFGFAFIWIAAFLPISTWLRQPLAPRLTIQLIGLLVAGLLGYYGVERMDFTPHVLTHSLFMPQQLKRLDHKPLSAFYDLRKTRSGLVVLVPHALQIPCFDSEQPCTPFFFDDLQLRGKTTQEGFRRSQTHTDSVTANTIRLVQQ